MLVPSYVAAYLMGEMVWVVPTLVASGLVAAGYAVDSARPWRGNGPIAVANLAGKLSAETVNALANESSGPVGRLLGIPVDGQDATVQALKADIRDARGRTALIETGDWANSGGNSKVDLKTERFGAEPPASLVQLVTIASQEVYSACGLNAGLWGGSQAAAVREAWRLCLFGVLSPLGRLVESELQGEARRHRDTLLAGAEGKRLVGQGAGLSIHGGRRYGSLGSRCRRWPHGGRLDHR